MNRSTQVFSLSTFSQIETKSFGLTMLALRRFESMKHTWLLDWFWLVMFILSGTVGVYPLGFTFLYYL